MNHLRVPATTLGLLLTVLLVPLAGSAFPFPKGPGGDESRGTAYPFVFRDAGDDAGLAPHVAGIRGHGAGWGDVDGDGWIDLYVATFHTDGSRPNLFLRNDKGKFRLDEQPALRVSTRATGVVFADLDNDGDLDLYVGSMPADKDSKLAQRVGHPLAGCTLFRNDGGGKFTDVSAGNGACPPAFGGRSATVLDYDGDGLLDLLVGEDPIPGYNGSKTKSSRLFRNKGGLQFEDVSRAVGLPEGVPGLGVAAAESFGAGAVVLRNVGELAAAVVAEQAAPAGVDLRLRHAAEVEVEVAVVVEVGEDHAGAAHGDVQRLLIVERELPLVVPEEHVRLTAIAAEGGDVEVEPAVAVYVAPPRPVTEDAADRRGQARLVADVAELEGVFGRPGLTGACHECQHGGETEAHRGGVHVALVVTCCGLGMDCRNQE